MDTTIIEMAASGVWPACVLSNFAPNRFVLDGVEIASMEGFLQSLKFYDFKTQVDVCRLVGRSAKVRGRHKKWWKWQRLYWQGVKYDRRSPEYQALLDYAYAHLFVQNEGFREALLATKGCTLTHPIGKTDPRITVLTVDEFCSRLTRLRDEGVK